MPEQNTSVEHVKEPRTLDEYLADYEDKYRQMGELNDRITEISDGQEFEGSDEANELAKSGDWDTAYDITIELYRSTHTEEQSAAALPIFEQIKALHHEAKTIDREAAPFAEARYAEVSKALVDDTDWDKVIEHMTAKHSNLDTGLAIKMLSDPGKYGKGDLDDVMYSIQTIARVHDDLRQEGFTYDEQHEASTEIYVGHGNLAGTIKGWVKDTKEAMHFISRSRYRMLNDALPVDDLTRLARLAEDAGLNGEPGTLTPGIIVDAMERAAGKRMIAFDNLDIDTIKKGYGERANLMLVSGAERLTKTADIQDPHAHFDALFHEWPHWFSQGTSVIEIVDHIPDDTPDTDSTENEDEQNKTEATSNRVTNGTWRQNGRTLQLSAHTQYYEDMVAFGAKNGRDEAFVRGVTCANRKEQIDHTTVHELAHKSHFNMFPIRWLREWYSTVGKDDKAPTEYVRVTKDKAKNPGEKDNQFSLEVTALIEDLSDSVAEYRYHPARLLRTSLERFALIQKLIEGYDMSVAITLIQMTTAIPEDDPDKTFKLSNLDNIGASYFRKAPNESPMFAIQ